MSNTTNVTSAFTALPQASTTNTTAQQSIASASNDSSMTLLTFGPLTSCIDLPDLSATTAPRTTNISAVAQQGVQTWLASLPSTTSCTPLSWTLRPDYSKHVDAVVTFQSQLAEMFASPLDAFASANASTQTAGSGFFPSNASSLFAGSSPNGALPETLPLWIGITIACATLVHLLSLILHVCSDLEALFPALAAKLYSEPELPQQHPNETSTTLVQEAADGDVKAEPPRYTAPTVVPDAVGGVELAETPALIRVSRKVKKVMVPLLLLAALGLVGVAVVLNAKFAVGPVGASAARVGDGASVEVSGVASLAAVSSASAVNGITSDAGDHRTSSATSSANADPASVATRTADAPPNGTVSSTSLVQMSSSMIKLVRRQTDFFPSPLPSSSVDALSAATTTATVTSSTPTSASASAFASTATAEPNASLFPINLSPTPSTTVPSTSTRSSTPSATLPASTAAASPAQLSSLLVLQRGDSTHRLWWIIMLDLLLWFAQR